MSASSAIMAMASPANDSGTRSQSLQFIKHDRDIAVYLQQPTGEERITLVNNNHQPIKLNSKHPISLQNINGSLVVKLNKTTGNGYMLRGGDVIMFDVQANGNTARIRSAHPAFNGQITALAT